MAFNNVGTFTEEEAEIVNTKAEFGSAHMFIDPKMSLSYIDMWRRQAVARLVGVNLAPFQGGGGLFMNGENRAKVASLLDRPGDFN